MSQANNPLHGLTLEAIVTRLQEFYGWDGLAERVRINCFAHEPSVKSSLKFLRRTPWAREAVEELYVGTFATGGSPVNVPAERSRKPARPRPVAGPKPANRPASAAGKSSGGFAWPAAKDKPEQD